MSVANVNPKFNSFTKLEDEWKISEIMEYKKPFFGSNHWSKTDEIMGIMGQIKEDYRKKTLQEVHNGPEELEWIIDPLKKQISNALELFFGSPERNIMIVDNFDNTFQTLDEFNDDNKRKLIQ